jgi:hypothetical protein
LAKGTSDYFCQTDSDCIDGLKCIKEGDGTRRCSTISANWKLCDFEAKVCLNDLKCVKVTTSGNYYRCSSGDNGMACSSTNDCKSGLKCVNYLTSGNWNACTDGNNSSVCNIDSDCDDGLICAKTSATTKHCTNKQLHSFCDKDSKACIGGLNCINNGIKYENWTCTDKKNGSECSVDNDCDSGLTCVNRKDDSKYCSNLSENSFCDKTKKICGNGLECKADSTGIYKCQKTATTPPTSTTNIPPVAKVVCGPLDVNGDDKIDFPDFAKFVEAWKKGCNDSPFSKAGCGGKDFNDDGMVDQKDFFNLVNKWKKPSCSV